MPLNARVAVCTGTFDPVHLGHLDVIRRGSRLYDRLIIGVGVNPEKSPFFTTEERVRLSAWIAAELGVPGVDVVVLNDAPPQLGRRIVTAGTRVFCADPEADHAFVRDVQLRAADLEPFLRRTRRVKLAAITR